MCVCVCISATKRILLRRSSDAVLMGGDVRGFLGIRRDEPDWNMGPFGGPGLEGLDVYVQSKSVHRTLAARSTILYLMNGDGDGAAAQKVEVKTQNGKSSGASGSLKLNTRGPAKKRAKRKQ